MDLYTVNGKVYVGLEAAYAAAKTAAAVKEVDYMEVYSLIIDEEGRPHGVLVYSVGPEGEICDSDDEGPEWDHTMAKMG